MANILVRWFITTVIAAVHPFYVSMIELNHNPKEKTVEVSVRIFSEDFENTLKTFSKTKIDLFNAKEKAINDKWIMIYLQNKLHITLDKKLVSLKYIGYEIQKESVWTYLEIEDVTDFKKVDINCSILYDFNDKQINIFHIKKAGLEKSYKLDYPKNVTSIEF